MKSSQDIWSVNLTTDPKVLEELLAGANAWRLDQRGQARPNPVHLALDRRGSVQFAGLRCQGQDGNDVYIFKGNHGLPDGLLYVRDADGVFFRKVLITQLRPGRRTTDKEEGVWVAYAGEISLDRVLSRDNCL